MAKKSPTVRYEDIETTSAQVLLNLRYEELNALLSEAERAANRADTIIHWLRGIKIEKSFRYGGDHG